MTKREVASLALKLSGIYAFIVSVSSVHTMMYMIASIGTQYDYPGTPPLLAAGSGIPLLLLLFLGFYLIAASERLSKRLFPQDAEEDKISPLSSEDVQTIAFSIVGVLLLTKAVPGLCRAILRIFDMYHRNLPSAFIKEHIVQDSVVMVQLALGLYLFLGGKGLSGLWHKLQRPRGM